jgi:xylulokinase
MGYVLGIDLGTSSLKAIFFDLEKSQIVADAQAEYPLYKPSPNIASQNPEDWWQAAIAVVRQLMALTNGRQPAAISFSGQMHGTVLLDRQGDVLQPAIIWADQRSALEAIELPKLIGESKYLAIAGTMPATGFMASTLLWLKKNQPEILANTASVLLPKDYLRYRMTGELGAEPTDAASTGLFDIRQKQWSSEICSAIDISLNSLPKLHESYEIAGELTPFAAEKLGLNAGIPVVMGAADQVAQALGNGLITTGRASVTIGSGGQIFVPLKQANLRTDARLHVFNHAVPDTYYVLGAILSAGLSLRWLRGITGLEGNPNAYEILSAEAAQVPAGANGLLFLPYLSGERSPHMDAFARGGFVGLSHYHQRGHLARAVMEGVTFALRQVLELSYEIAGRPDSLVAAGGASESSLWRQIQADIFGRPLQKSLLREQAGVGASLLAGIGIGFYQDFSECAKTVEAYDEATSPDSVAIYEEMYAQFCSLYPLLKPSFHYLSKTSHR